ncbi:hypothetical protein [Marinimicrobium sp. C2-29]|uniref:hypothetical protein n=1 Tax=Marinimicrobium sp. C2-29 TaxID=3139825 RepID=UPI003138B75E
MRINQKHNNQNSHSTTQKPLAKAVAGLIASASLLVAPAATQALELTEGLDVNLYLAQHAQSVEADSGAGAASDTTAGFSRTRFNLQFNVRFNEWLTGFVDLAEEPNDFGNDFGIQNDLTFLDVALLKAFGSSAAENNSLTFRLGQPVMTTFNFRGYSDGAQVQGNPLIGNSPLDIVAAQVGGQVLGQHKFDGPIESIGWDVMVSSGNFGERFDGNQGQNLGLRARLAVTGGLKVGVGYMTGDNDNGVTSSGFLGDGDNINLQLPNGAQDTRNLHAAIIPGVDFDFAMADFEYAHDRFTVRGWYGAGEDSYSFASTEGRVDRSAGVVNTGTDAEMSGFGFTGEVYVIPKVLYLAGRYTEVTNDSDNVSSDDTLDRTQLGAGLWLSDNSLLKIEYVAQGEEDNSGGQIGEDWDGVLVELSTKF